MSERTRNRDRSRSPFRDGHRHHHRHRLEHGDHRSRDRPDTRPVVLPYQQADLTKHDLQAYRPMFGLFLDIQKDIDIHELAEDEVKGRWKSFIKKWNRGDLAEGWYDPITLSKAQAAQQDQRPSQRHPEDETSQKPDTDNDDDNSDFGPSMPGRHDIITRERNDFDAGPTIPSVDDLRGRDDDARSAAEQAREQRLMDMKLERKAERKQENERLEEIVPRADAGTRERQLEKKRDLAESNRTFAASKDAGEVEMQDSDLMGEDTLSALKTMKKQEERKKSERELRREEFARARAAEREERSQKLRQKEAKTMDMLRELARTRFGDGNERSATLGENL